MNGYVCFYKGKRVEVRAETPYKAQLIAAEQLQKGQRAKVKICDISATLAELGETQVTHKPIF